MAWILHQLSLTRILFQDRHNEDWEGLQHALKSRVNELHPGKITMGDWKRGNVSDRKLREEQAPEDVLRLYLACNVHGYKAVGEDRSE